jgi:hypothetical protein
MATVAGPRARDPARAWREPARVSEKKSEGHVSAEPGAATDERGGGKEEGEPQWPNPSGGSGEPCRRRRGSGRRRPRQGRDRHRLRRLS